MQHRPRFLDGRTRFNSGFSLRFQAFRSNVGLLLRLESGQLQKRFLIERNRVLPFTLDIGLVSFSLEVFGFFELLAMLSFNITRSLSMGKKLSALYQA